MATWAGNSPHRVPTDITSEAHNSNAHLMEVQREYFATFNAPLNAATVRAGRRYVEAMRRHADAVGKYIDAAEKLWLP